MNDTFIEIHNPIFDIVVKTHTPNNHTPSVSLQPLTVSSPLSHTTRLYTDIPTYTDTPQRSSLDRTDTA